ncbi:hypothetical protein SDJN02_10085, partial [Cucurbita argyrosperma subsp. argyrosperma]
MAGSISSLEMAISSVFSRWDGLQMAIDHKWGGGDSHQKPLNLASDVFSWFSQSKRCYIKITFRSFSIFFHGSNSVMLPSIAAPLYVEDLENLLHEQHLLLSFNTEIEDGSIEQDLCSSEKLNNLPIGLKRNPPRIIVINVQNWNFVNG